MSDSEDTITNLPAALALILCIGGSMIGWPSVLPAQLVEAVPVPSTPVPIKVVRAMFKPLEVCNGDRVIIYSGMRQGEDGPELYEESHCVWPLEDIEVSKAGAFEIMVWGWDPGSQLKVCRSFDPVSPCCTRPGFQLDDGIEVPSSQCPENIAIDGSPFVYVCGWDLRDFDASGCADTCRSELQAAGWPGEHSSQPGGLRGVTCCVRAPLTPPRPLPADIGRCPF